VSQQQFVAGLAGEMAGTAAKISTQQFATHRVTTAIGTREVAAWFGGTQISLVVPQGDLTAVRGFLTAYPIPTSKNSTLG
jgi:hypothetical protein